MSSSDAPQHRATAEARARILTQRDTIRTERTRSFLVAQTALLAIGAAIALTAAFVGVDTALIVTQSVIFTGFMTLITILGWVLFWRRQATTAVVVGLLYVDSVVVLFFLYIGGEFEVGLSMLTYALVMAPVFAGGRHVWGLAAFQTAVYLGLLACRQFALIPYGELLPAGAVTQPAFVAESIGGFLIVTFGIAYLAGRASIDILTSQHKLEGEVERQTRQLAEANAELANANAELHASNTALDQYNAAVSHDLRGPLQTLTGTIELLAVTEPNISPRGQERLQLMGAATDRMGAMIHELRRLSLVGEELDARETVDLNQTVAAVCGTLEATIADGDAQVQVVDQLPTTVGNPALLEQVVQNLLENAIKYGGQTAPRVRIGGAVTDGGRIALAVEDDGEGIEPADRQRVFQMFQRLDRHHGTGGIGAGLAIVERIVLAHGGRLRVERSVELGGARFVVELPGGPALTLA